MSPKTECHHCGAIGFVREEHILRVMDSYTQCYCARCNKAWFIAGDRETTVLSPSTHLDTRVWLSALGRLRPRLAQSVMERISKLRGNPAAVVKVTRFR